MNNFNSIAPFYTTLAKLVLGSVIKESQYIYLDRIKAGDKILLIGDGTGIVLSKLPGNKNLRIDYIESAEAMITRAKKNIPNNFIGEINFHQQSFFDYSSKEKYDIIVTNFFLDLFRDEETLVLIKKIDELSKPGTNWILTDFQKKGGKFNKFLLWMMYRFFRLIAQVGASTLPDYMKFVKKTNYKTEESHEFRHGFVISRRLVKQ